MLWETALVAVLGLFAALAANYISPRGLSLTRDYFPPKHKIGPHPGGATPARQRQGETNPTPAAVLARPETEIATVTTAQALELFHDPQYEQELIVFVDARDDRHYEEGHVPGAYQLDRYHPENHLPTVLPACLDATRVVVYCTGGECEDSHFAAQSLQEAGVPTERLSVYAGGMTEWEARRLPVESGARKSGKLRTAKP